ncbi:MAG: DUF5606 domain-containing protein [Bacteroidota bacterium]|jgi:Domain of unknown function (DUF5606)
MDLTKIVSISGKAGLFKVVSQGKNAVIVESIADQKRFPAFGHEKMSSLEEISVFTTGEDRPLKDVFKAFHEKFEGKETPDPKSENNALLKFFADMVPDFDKERVYVSDIRKMMSWYNLLLSNNLLDFTEEPVEKTETPEVKDVATEIPAADENKPADEDVTESKPEKKAARTKNPE